MTKLPLFTALAFATGLTLSPQSVCAQERTPPFTAEEREQAYTATIAKRATAALELLAVSDTAKSNRVHELIMKQYRALRARDEALDTMFKTLSQDAPGVETNRSAVLMALSRQLHKQFIAKLEQDLTPAQVEIVKDRMTYNKLRVTFDAYCAILPGLTHAEKTQVLEHLRDAREEAMDGGTADEKSAIFQKYKDLINAYLGQHGYDVAKATREWEAKQAAAKPAENVAPAN